MTRTPLCLALLAIASPCLAQSAPKIDDFTVAGIHVIHKTITANDVIGVQLFVKGGAAAITPKNAGSSSPPRRRRMARRSAGRPIWSTRR